jgi:hypothetical protein
MKHSQQKLVVILIIIGGLLIIAVAGYYISLGRTDMGYRTNAMMYTFENVPSNVNDGAALYTNDKLGFAFYYPKTWKVSSNKNVITLGEVGKNKEIITLKVVKASKLGSVDSKASDAPVFATISGLQVFGGTNPAKTNIVALPAGGYLVVNTSAAGIASVIDPLTKGIVFSGQKLDAIQLSNSVQAVLDAMKNK